MDYIVELNHEMMGPDDWETFLVKGAETEQQAEQAVLKFITDNSPSARYPYKHYGCAVIFRGRDIEQVGTSVLDTVIQL